MAWWANPCNDGGRLPWGALWAHSCAYILCSSNPALSVAPGITLGQSAPVSPPFLGLHRHGFPLHIPLWLLNINCCRSTPDKEGREGPTALWGAWPFTSQWGCRPPPSLRGKPFTCCQLYFRSTTHEEGPPKYGQQFSVQKVPWSLCGANPGAGFISFRPHRAAFPHMLPRLPSLPS